MTKLTIFEYIVIGSFCYLFPFVIFRFNWLKLFFPVFLTLIFGSFYFISIYKLEAGSIDPIFFDLDDSSQLRQLALIGFYVLFTIFCKLFDEDNLKEENHLFYLVILFGGLLLSRTNDLLAIFLLLEIISFCNYTLVAIKRNNYSLEANIKYLIFGSLGGLFFAIGSIFYFSYSGTLDIGAALLLQTFGEEDVTHSVFYLLFVLSFMIKMGIGPAYIWVPDVYQAANYSTFVFFATFSKIVLVMAFSNIFVYFPEYDVCNIISLILILASTVYAVYAMGNQNDFRRIFSYSSIINTGLISGAAFSMFPTGPILIYKLIFFYAIVSLLTYASFKAYGEINRIGAEPLTIEKASTYAGSSTSWLFGASVVLNTGLPPLGLFYVKMLSIGIIFYNGDPFSTSIAGFFLLSTLGGMYVYFFILIRVFDYTFDPLLRIVPKNHKMKRQQVVFLLSLFFFVALISMFFYQYIKFL
jgi:NADH:ubiquinone oxidoreductase subunit 2 (subunit N)